MPEKPTLTVQPGNGTVTLSATTTLGDGTAISKWQYLQWTGTDEPEDWEQHRWQDISQTGLTMSHAVGSLSNGTEYKFRVRAVNTAGSGVLASAGIQSDEIAIRPHLEPSKPTVSNIFSGDRLVAFDASASDHGGYPITTWGVRHRLNPLGGALGSWTSWATEQEKRSSHNLVVQGLANGTRYDIQVRAQNEIGWGAAAQFQATPAPSNDGNQGNNGSTGGVTGGGGGGGGGGGAKPLRLSGSTRYATAKAVGDQLVELLETSNPASGGRVNVTTAIVASGKAFPDALTASALSRVLRAPVLLTDPKRLDSAVTAFITKHRISKVVIVGGRAAVSAEVEAALGALSEVRDVVRHSGPDRYSTAAQVASEVGAPGLLCRSTKRTVILTTGRNYPDALVAGPLAYRGTHPILLTERDRLPGPIAEYLSASTAQHAIVIGGRSAVGDEVVDAVEALGLTTQRISGSDRADTSVQVARFLTGQAGTGTCFRTDSIGLATGYAFPDALAAAPLLGQYGAPLLLTSPRGMPQPLLDYAASGRLQRDFDLPPVVTVGGTSAVPSRHPTQLLAALPRDP